MYVPPEMVLGQGRKSSVGELVNTGEYGRETVGRRHADGGAGPAAARPTVVPAGNGYPASKGHHARSGQESQSRKDRRPPPAAKSATRVTMVPDLPQRRETEPQQREVNWAVSYDNGIRRAHVISDDIRGAVEPDSGPATEWLQNGASRSQRSFWIAAQVLDLADGRAAQIAREADDRAAALRESAQREAAAITERATRQAAAIRGALNGEAAELKARLDVMSGQLARVAAYVAEGLASPALPTTDPPLRGARPALPGARPTEATTGSAKPDTGSAKPDATPRTGPAGSARPRAASARRPQQQPRQLQAMRFATSATAALVALAVLLGVAEVGMHGVKFFLFREAGVGHSGKSDTETDQQFLAQQASMAQHDAAQKDRHH